MNLIKILTCLLLLLCIGSTVAQAHDPYARKIATLKDSEGRTVIVEKLYGDGIIGPDPANLQIRNDQGGVVAYSPTGNFLIPICPYIQFCFAIPHSAPFMISPVWKLDYESVDFSEKRNQDPCHDNINSDLKHRATAKELCEYVTNSEKRGIREYGSTYPEFLKEPLNFSPAPFMITLISPLIIIMMNIHIFLGYFFFGNLIERHERWIKEKILLSERTNSEFLWKSARIISFILSIACMIILPLASSVLLDTPVLYSYFFIIMGTLICRKYSRNKDRRNLHPAF